MPDKNEAIIKFLMECEEIQNNPLFFNFADADDGNNHIISQKDTVKRHYIDGSVLKQYTFIIACYSSVAHIAIQNDESISDKNMENMAYVQKILDWIDLQAHPIPTSEAAQPAPHFPDFGPLCEINDMTTINTDPDIDGIDTSVNPPIARYSIGVNIEYLDKSKMIFN